MEENEKLKTKKPRNMEEETKRLSKYKMRIFVRSTV